MFERKYLSVVLLILSVLAMSTTHAATLQALTDEQLSETTGQALMSLTYIAPTDTANLEARRTGGDSTVGFYKLGLEATVELNANIKKLQLGCGGTNGSGACDLDLDSVSFGCITGAAGYCITSATTNPNQPTGIDSNNAISNQKNMKDFVLTNPYFQFAIKNPNSASTREVVGIRIGAEKAEGPLSIGNLNSFSGYFTGKANLTMLGETNVSPVTSTTWNSRAISTPSAFLGLDDATILNLGLASVKYSEITANYSTVSRNGLAVSVVGNRVSQAKIIGLDLSSVVDDIINGTSTTSALELNTSNSCVRIIGICSGSFGANIGNALLPVLRGGISDYIKQQLATGLGTSVSGLSTYQMPYNLSNVHQIDVNSNTFGIALSAQNLQYPDYAAAVSKGWSMYLQDAFTLNISDKVSNLVSNIASSSNAKDGNITLLEQPYRNCYGSLKFC
ncbi:hypothetical protein [Acinetobacter guillouiae]|uniref:hypothetical protein n=1 Tax=Acinetobacter guillouiae TaxID=106649 RepID=UPI0002CDA60E|nr:hypothetical protein [Acinetobacter guillouiae]ENU57329.1 hypothetical protein F981_03753 [Acinetobacter guillouiae CIP 63.46]KAB0624706.1 hypothetical protein F7P82_17800 [Acinetobacter guillouiae]MDO6645560.1 hypothetical protein [Acinetobacter guillouiae]